MSYTISIRTTQDGERVVFLLDERGIPCFYPTLFCTSQLRNNGAAVNTMRNKLADILVLLRWEENNKRDLAREFSSGKFLTLQDVMSLRDFTILKRGKATNSKSSVIKGQSGKLSFIASQVQSIPAAATIGKKQVYNRLSTIADYLEFLGLIRGPTRKSAQYTQDLIMMVRQIRAHRPKGVRANWNDDLNESSPPTAVVERFMAVVAFDSPDNPFKNVDVKLRNSLLFGLLFYTGMRRGELLSLRIDQFELGEHPLVWVRRNQDDLHDSRRYQPVSKTKERPLPLPRHLADQIHSYILNVRSKLAMARRHPYLFVSHRADKTQGQPLSISAFGSQIMTKARLAVPEFSQIHPHSFRHHFNYRMSIAIDKLNIDAVNGTSGIARPSISDAQELDARAFLNGHRSRKSGAIYNKRHTKEVADKVGKSIQNEILGTSLLKVRIDQQP